MSASIHEGEGRIALVTGAAGFIGSHFTEALLRTGSRVIGIDNFDDYYNPELKARNLVAAKGNKRFRLEADDVRDHEKLADIMKEEGVNVVYHLAGRVGVRGSNDHEELYTQHNVDGTEAVVEAMRLAGVSNLMFTGSSSVYGNSATVPFSEDDPTEPISAYGRSKLAAEQVIRKYSEEHGINATVCRVFTAYGPRQRPDMAISRFVDACLDDETVPLYDQGESERDYTHVSDVVVGMLMTGRDFDGYRVVNIGTGTSHKLADLVQMISTYVGKPLSVSEAGTNPEELRVTQADITKARSMGFTPVWTLSRGLREYVRWVGMRPTL